jgi:hypothetical protein
MDHTDVVWESMDVPRPFPSESGTVDGQPNSTHVQLSDHGRGLSEVGHHVTVQVASSKY